MSREDILNRIRELESEKQDAWNQYNRWSREAQSSSGDSERAAKQQRDYFSSLVGKYDSQIADLRSRL